MINEIINYFPYQPLSIGQQLSSSQINRQVIKLIIINELKLIVTFNHLCSLIRYNDPIDYESMMRKSIFPYYLSILVDYLLILSGLYYLFTISFNCYCYLNFDRDGYPWSLIVTLIVFHYQLNLMKVNQIFHFIFMQLLH